MARTFAYCRVSTADQTTDNQVREIEAAGFTVDPKRIILRDAKSYCAILLDDNNRKTIARMWFNGVTVKYFGTFSGKEEYRHQLPELTAIYQLAPQIEARLRELDGTIAA